VARKPTLERRGAPTAVELLPTPEEAAPAGVVGGEVWERHIHSSDGTLQHVRLYGE